MNYDIFTDEEDKQKAREALPSLEKHDGWKFITRTIDVNIAFLTNQLKERNDFDNLEQVYAIQDRIDDLAKLKELPTTILAEIKVEPEEEEETIYE